MGDPRVLPLMCDVCGDEIDFPAQCAVGEDGYPCEDGSECADPEHMCVREDDQATCTRCGAVGRVALDGEYATCVIDDDDPAWAAWDAKEARDAD